jgi:hypothetical protein
MSDKYQFFVFCEVAKLSNGKVTLDVYDCDVIGDIHDLPFPEDMALDIDESFCSQYCKWVGTRVARRRSDIFLLQTSIRRTYTHLSGIIVTGKEREFSMVQISIFATASHLPFLTWTLHGLMNCETGKLIEWIFSFVKTYFCLIFFGCCYRSGLCFYISVLSKSSNIAMT